jgi:hypothetical protein
MKRIVICADGTWNIRDQIDKRDGRRHPTNVTKLARAVLLRAADGTSQIVYYHEGVGSGLGLDRYTGGAFGRGIEANIRELYRFLVYNYDLDDHLFFFGFSRGAFTVRTLASFMAKVGLICKGDDYYVPEVYSCYEKQDRLGSPEWAHAHHNIRTPRPCPSILFVGVWDNLGALGAPGLMGQLFNRGKYKYHDVGLGPHILNAYQALAIDEQRKAFAPNLWTRDRPSRTSLVRRRPHQCRRRLLSRWLGERSSALDRRKGRVPRPGARLTIPGALPPMLQLRAPQFHNAVISSDGPLYSRARKAPR